MGEDVNYIFVVRFLYQFFFIWFTSPLFSQAREAHRQADGLQSIAYRFNEPHWGAHVGGGGCLLGAGLAALGA